jgi:hypothetical protein
VAVAVAVVIVVVVVVVVNVVVVNVVVVNVVVVNVVVVVAVAGGIRSVSGTQRCPRTLFTPAASGARALNTASGETGRSVALNEDR